MKLKVVNHKNEEKMDNSLANLEWVTQLTNIQRCTKNTSHPRKVIQIFNDGINILHESITNAAKEMGLSRAAISKACLDINKTANGYSWRYEDSDNNHTAIDLGDGKQIKQSPNYYVFADGTVYGTKRRSFLKPVKNASGYCYVTLCHPPKKRNYYIHRLVAEYFLPSPNTGRIEINHKNKVRSDNKSYTVL